MLQASCDVHKLTQVSLVGDAELKSSECIKSEAWTKDWFFFPVHNGGQDEPSGERKCVKTQCNTHVLST